MSALGDIWRDYAVCAGLTARYSPVGACKDPECELCTAGEETWCVAVTEAAEEWWTIIGFTTDPDAMIAAALRDDLEENAKVVSILYGASWDTVKADPLRVYTAQLFAVGETPARYYHLEPEELKCVRRLLNTPNPLEVCALLKLTERWSQDPGGTRGPWLGA